MVWCSFSSATGELWDILKCRKRQCLRHIIVDILRFDYVNETVGVGVCQFSLVIILCYDLLVMKTVHGDFKQVQNRTRKASIEAVIRRNAICLTNG